MSTVSPALSDSQGTSPTFARGFPGPTSYVVAQVEAGSSDAAATKAMAMRLLCMSASLFWIV